MKTNPFAGLMAGFRGARADDDKSDDDEAVRAARRAEEDEQREQEDARRAEEDQRRNDEDARRAEEDGGNDKTDARKSEKAVDEDQDPDADAEDDDADAEDGMDEKESKAFRRGLAVGRARENTRSSRIFLAAAVVGRPDFAATLAFTTRNPSAAAARLLNDLAATQARRGNLDQRMVARPEPRPGAGGGSVSKPSFGDRVAAAVGKVRA